MTNSVPLKPTATPYAFLLAFHAVLGGLVLSSADSKLYFFGTPLLIALCGTAIAQFARNVEFLRWAGTGMAIWGGLIILSGFINDGGRTSSGEWVLIATGLVIYLAAVEWMYVRPFKPYEEWIKRNGLNWREKEVHASDPLATPRRANEVSKADELGKWAALLEGGHIDRVEFERAKKAILES